MTYDKTPLEKDGITVMVGGQQGGHQGAAPTPPLKISSLGAVKHPGSPAQHHTEAGAELEAQLSRAEAGALKRDVLPTQPKL